MVKAGEARGDDFFMSRLVSLHLSASSAAEAVRKTLHHPCNIEIIHQGVVCNALLHHCDAQHK